MPSDEPLLLMRDRPLHLAAETLRTVPDQQRLGGNLLFRYDGPGDGVLRVFHKQSMFCDKIFADQELARLSLGLKM
jgi:hypothetical protein